MTNQQKALEVRCVECRQYAYHDPEKYSAVIAGLDIEPDYVCSGCVKRKTGNPYSCCDEREKLKARVKQLEEIVVRFAQDAAR